MLAPWQWGIVVVFGMLMAAVVVGFAVYPRVVKGIIRDQGIAKVEEKIGRSVSVGSIHVSRTGRIVLKDIRIVGRQDPEGKAIASIPRITIEYSFWQSLSGVMVVERVEVKGMQLALHKDGQGIDNYSDVVKRIGQGRGAKEGGITRSSRLQLGMIDIIEAKVDWADAANGVHVSVENMGAEVGQGEVIATMNGVTVAAPMVSDVATDQMIVSARLSDPIGTARVKVLGGQVSPWTGMALTNIEGDVSRGSEPGRLQIDLRGSYGGIRAPLWSAKGWIEPLKKTASVRVNASKFTFDKLDRVLKDTVLMDYTNTAMNVDLNIDVNPAGGQVSGAFEVSGLSMFHPKLASEPIRDLALQGKEIRLDYDVRTRRFNLHSATLSSGGVDAVVSGSVGLPGGINHETGQARVERQVMLGLQVPKTPCQRVFNAIPSALVPRLRGFELAGDFRSNVRIEVDWADLDKTVLEGDVGIWGCRVKKAPEGVDAERLKGSFVHQAPGAYGKDLSLTIGPSNPNYVSLWEVSPYLLKSLRTTEDSRFYSHRGYIGKEFRTALVKNLKAGRFKFGASSITMQLVKNVMLSREKTMARKLQELILTWYVESTLTKNRILEIYVNAIEYGPNLYGIGAASRRYFGKHARDLNPVEAAFFSSILPAPKRRYRQYCSGKLWEWTNRKIQRILDIMYKRERLNEEEYVVALATPLVFDHSRGRIGCYQSARTSR